MAYPPTDPAIRFRSKVDKHGPRVGRHGRCWVWTAYCDAAGYGHFLLTKDMTTAHRAAWLLVYGPDSIPEGMWVLHRCDNPPCVRLSHLFLGTPQMNSIDMVQKGRCTNSQKQQCPGGHPYDQLDEKGARRCRACRRERHQERRHARAA